MIIIQDGVKRRLDASKPFQLQLTSDEAESIVRQLSVAIEESEGWGITADINPKIEISNALDQAVPLGWTDPGNVNLSVDAMRRRALDPDYLLRQTACDQSVDQLSKTVDQTELDRLTVAN